MQCLGVRSRSRAIMTLNLGRSQRVEVSQSGSRSRTGSRVGARYWTRRGVMYSGSADELLTADQLAPYRGKVRLIFTSPPFPLNRKKKYGNYQGPEYIAWLSRFAPIFRDLLADNGSVVMEMGNAWEPGQPVMSTLALEAL